MDRDLDSARSVLSCGNSKINAFPANQPVADFFCVSCKEEYEFKSQKNKFGSRIAGNTACDLSPDSLWLGSSTTTSANAATRRGLMHGHACATTIVRVAARDICRHSRATT